MADAWLEGMMLAAVIADDERGDAVEAGLSDSSRSALRRGLAALAAQPKEQRRTRVAQMAAALRHLSPNAALPAAAARLMASEVPRDVGRRWLSDAPAVRRGYRADPFIKSTLRRCAGPPDPDVADDERRAAGAVDVAFSPARAASLRRWAERLAAGRPLDRVLGALALGALAADAHTAPRGDDLTRDLHRIGAELGRVWSTPWPG